MKTTYELLCKDAETLKISKEKVIGYFEKIAELDSCRGINAFKYSLKEIEKCDCAYSSIYEYCLLITIDSFTQVPAFKIMQFIGILNKFYPTMLVRVFTNEFNKFQCHKPTIKDKIYFSINRDCVEESYNVFNETLCLSELTTIESICIKEDYNKFSVNYIVFVNNPKDKDEVMETLNTYKSVVTLL